MSEKSKFTGRDTAESIRLQRAADLINASDKTVSQISVETGFGGTGETLCAKLVQQGYVTEKDLRDHRKALNIRNQGGVNEDDNG
jgi:transcriptional regulator GlxA family with amidase domain